jgi:hypothetical protein
MVHNAKNEFLGIAYLRVKDQRLYNMLIGKNPDGTNRIEVHDDYDWRPPSQETIENIERQLSTLQEPIFDETDWGKSDWDIRQYEALVAKIKSPLTPGKITVTLDPLIKLQPYKLDASQKERYRVRQLAKNKDDPNFSPDSVVIPDYLEFTIDRAAIVQQDVKYAPHILKCVNLPSYVTKQYLKDLFSTFASDTTTLYHWNLFGVHSCESFPFIYVDKTRTACIIFDAYNHDAEFALFLTKRTVLPRNTHAAKQDVLWFGNAFIVDREVPKEITKMHRPKAVENNYDNHDSTNTSDPSVKNHGQASKALKSSTVKSKSTNTTNSRRQPTKK